MLLPSWAVVAMLVVDDADDGVTVDNDDGE